MSTPKRYLPFLFFFLVALGQYLRWKDWHFDDAEIVYRIVENLKTHGVWSFNLDELKNSSTSSLHTIIVALLSFLGPIPLVTHALGAVSLFCAGYFSFHTLKGVTGEILALITGFVGILVLGEGRTWGLETQLFCACVSYIMYREVQSKPLFFLYGVLVLIRPDALVLLVFRCLFFMIEKKRFPLYEGMLAILPVVPWIIFSLIQFHEVFPDTLSSKRWQGSSGLWGQGRIYLKGLKEILGRDSSVMIMSFLSIPGFILAPRILKVLGLFFAAQQFSYIYLNVPPYHWYFIPFLFSLTFFAAIALSQIQRINRPIHTELWLFAFIISLLSIGRAIKYPEKDPRREAYLSAAKKADTLPEGPLGTLEVGTVGFYTKRKIIDFVGLTSQNKEYVSGVHVDEFYKSPPQIVLLHWPLWHFERAIFDDVRFALLYEPSIEVPDPLFPTKYFILKSESSNNPRALLQSQLPSWREVKLNKYATDPTALCIVDQLNGSFPTRGNILKVRRPALSVTGWGVSENGNKTDSLTVLLSRKGSALSLRAKRVEREDVAKHLSNPNARKSGFQVKGLFYPRASGVFKVIIKQSERSFCDTGIKLRLVGG